MRVGSGGEKYESGTWLGTFQNYSGATSSAPRLGHILQRAGATVPLNNINFVDGD